MGKWTEAALKRAEQISNIIAEAASLAQGRKPSATVGLLAEGFPNWEENKAYSQYELFVYDGKVGFTRQALTSQKNYPPFSTGTEALYGVRSIPNVSGIYPYIYNMAAKKGMKVRSEKDNKIYICKQSIDSLFYDPAEVPALFSLEEGDN